MSLPVPQAFNYECGYSPTSAALCAQQNEADVQTQTNSMSLGGGRRKRRGGNSGTIEVQMPQNDLAATSPQNSSSNTLQSYESISQGESNSVYDECVFNPNTPACQASLVASQNGGKHKKHPKNKSHKKHKKGGKKSHKHKLHKKHKNHTKKNKHSRKHKTSKRGKKGGNCTCPPCSFYKGKASFCCGMKC